MATYNIRTTSVQDWRDTMMSKAEFNAVAKQESRNNAGSGFIEFGKHVATLNINEGITASSTWASYFALGRTSSAAGTSKTNYSIANINGTLNYIKYLNSTDEAQSNIILPPAPTILPSTATLTQQQIDSGVIKHADASNSGLIVNGKFDTDTSGWSVVAGVAYSASTLAFTSISAATDFATQTLNGLVVGKKYVIEYEIKTLSAGGVGWYLPSANTAVYYNAVGRVYGEFTATATTHVFSLRANGTTTGTVDNISVFPADAISRSDLVFLESWHEDISEKGVVYRYGNVQFKGASESAFGTQVTPSAGTPVFAGYGTYSLFSDTWQADEALIGNCYRWDPLYMTDAQRKAFVADPENNCYLDGDKVIQVRYRMRVVMGLGDSWINVDTNLPYSSPYYSALLGSASSGVSPKGKLVNTNDFGTYAVNGSFIGKYHPTAIGYGVDGMFSASGANGTLGLLNSYDNKCFALPIALVHRRNTGMMHPVYNPNGTKLASDSLPWYSTTISFTSIADCFTDSKLLTASGYIGTTTGRADGIFYDQVHEGDITDLRMNSRGMNDYQRTSDNWFAKLQVGTYRGTEKEWTTSRELQTVTNTSSNTIYVADTLNYQIGDTIQMFNEYDSAIRVGVITSIASTYIVTTVPVFNRQINTYVIVSKKSTRTKSNTLTHTDIIGSPTNYPTTWKQSGVSGVPLIVAEDGTSMLPTGTTGSDGLATFKLSRKANATPLQVIKSTDSGATWTALNVTTHYTFSTTTNAITFTAGNIPLTTDLVRVTYQTHTNMAVAAVNSEVLAVGNCIASNYYNNADTYLSFNVMNTLIGKTGVAGTTTVVRDQMPLDYSLGSSMTFRASYNSPISHRPVALTVGSSPTVKVFPYLTRSNGKAYLQLVFKEMKYGSYAAPTVVTAASATYTINMTYKINIAGCALDGKVIQWTAATATVAVDWSLYDVSPTGVIYLLSSGAVYASARLYDGDSWGDDSKFNIVDNVSTTTDTNGATVLIGQKRVELPYFIGAAE